MPVTNEELDNFAHRYAGWAAGIEQQARQEAQALSPRMIEIAREMGLSQPESLRILIKEKMPFPMKTTFCARSASAWASSVPGS